MMRPHWVRGCVLQFPLTAKTVGVIESTSQGLQIRHFSVKQRVLRCEQQRLVASHVTKMLSTGVDPVPPGPSALGQKTTVHHMGTAGMSIVDLTLVVRPVFCMVKYIDLVSLAC